MEIKCSPIFLEAIVNIIDIIITDIVFYHMFSQLLKSKIINTKQLY